VLHTASVVSRVRHTFSVQMNASVSWGFHPRLVCKRPSASLASLRLGIDYINVTM